MSRGPWLVFEGCVLRGWSRQLRSLLVKPANRVKIASSATVRNFSFVDEPEQGVIVKFTAILMF